jgi:hypothetical protein
MPVWVRVYLAGEGYQTLRLNSMEDAESLCEALDNLICLKKDEVERGNVLVYKEDD